jgi:hypothetical protein
MGLLICFAIAFVKEIYEYVQRQSAWTDPQTDLFGIAFRNTWRTGDGDGLANYKFASFNTTHEADRQLILELGPSASAKPNYSVAGSQTPIPYRVRSQHRARVPRILEAPKPQLCLTR